MTQNQESQFQLLTFLVKTICVKINLEVGKVVNFETQKKVRQLVGCQNSRSLVKVQNVKDEKKIVKTLSDKTNSYNSTYQLSLKNSTGDGEPLPWAEKTEATT